jgi:hypothetical protein
MQPIAPIVIHETMADVENPDPLQVDAIARKAGDAAMLDPQAVLAAVWHALPRIGKENAVARAGSSRAAYEAQTFEDGPFSAGEIQQTHRIAPARLQHGTADMPIPPTLLAAQDRTGRQTQCRAKVAAGREKYGLAGKRGVVEGALERFGVVLNPIADSTMAACIDRPARSFGGFQRVQRVKFCLHACILAQGRTVVYALSRK